MAKFVIKASGDQEQFSVEKFQRSLQKAGADPDLIGKLSQEVLHNPELVTTHDIYHYAYEYLKKSHRPIAARYNLKQSLLLLGPSGFPFEKFVAEIFKRKGYETAVDQTIQGFCVDHEIDVVLKKENLHIMIECKFHHGGIKADVKIPLYIKARFDDVVRNQSSQDHHIHQSWIITNSKFTSKAEQYANCIGLTLISWSYPARGNLAELIESQGLHPVTTLTSLSGRQKKSLIEHGVVLCQDLATHKDALRNVGLNALQIQQAIDEANAVCKMGHIE